MPRCASAARRRRVTSTGKRARRGAGSTARPERRGHVSSGMPAADTIATSAAAGLRHATLAVYAVFFGSGFAFSSWASRIPQVRDALDLSPAQPGPPAAVDRGRLGHRTSACRDRRGAAGRRAHDRRDGDPRSRRPHDRRDRLPDRRRPGRGRALPVRRGERHLGRRHERRGAFVERRLRRSIMPRFHAGFSVGAVSGALLGAGMVAAGRLDHGALPDRGRPDRVRRAVGGRWFLTVSASGTTTGSRPGIRSPPGRSRARSRSGCSCSAWRSSRAPGTTGSASPSSTATTRRRRSAR